MSKKETVAALPAGCEYMETPVGVKVIVKTPRAPGKYWRVKHETFGHRTIKADTSDKALAEFAAEVDPVAVNNKDRFVALTSRCRVSSFIQPATKKVA